MPPKRSGDLLEPRRRAPKRQQWLYKCRGSDLTYDEPGRKIESLRSLCVKALLRNLDTLTPEMLDSLPGHLAKHIWTKLRKSNLDCLKATLLWSKWLDQAYDTDYCRWLMSRVPASLYCLAGESRWEKQAFDACSVSDILAMVALPGRSDHTISLHLEQLALTWADIHDIGKAANVVHVTFSACTLEGEPLALKARFARQLASMATESSNYFKQLMLLIIVEEPVESQLVGSYGIARNSAAILESLPALKTICHWRPSKDYLYGEGIGDMCLASNEMLKPHLVERRAHLTLAFNINAGRGYHRSDRWPTLNVYQRTPENTFAQTQDTVGLFPWNSARNKEEGFDDRWNADRMARCFGT